jgi:hypothetical protein
MLSLMHMLICQYGFMVFPLAPELPRVGYASYRRALFSVFPETTLLVLFLRPAPVPDLHLLPWLDSRAMHMLIDHETLPNACRRSGALNAVAALPGGCD